MYCKIKIKQNKGCPSKKYNLVFHCVKGVRIRSYSGPHFPGFWLNAERYSASHRIHCKCGKMRTGVTSNTNTFHAMLKHFHQNLRVYPRSKNEFALTNDWEILHTGKNLSKGRCWWTNFVCPKYSWGFWVESERQENSPFFKLGRSISSSWTDTKLLFKYEHFFFLKAGNLVTKLVPLSLLQTYCVWKTILKIW